MQEKQEGYQEKEQEGPEENGPVDEAEDPSLAEKEAVTEGEEPVEESEEEDRPVEEAEEAELIEEELVQTRGCLRGCLTPIVVVFAIVLVAVMIGYSRRSALRSGLLKRIIANTQEHALSELPDGMDEKTIEATFEKVKTALKEGRIDEEALTEAIEEYQDATQKRLPLEQRKQEIDKLMAGLNGAIIVPME